jgi:hypothetical protein
MHSFELEPFGEGNRAPVFRIEGAEVAAVRNRWVRLRQGRHTLEAFHWKVDVRDRMRGLADRIPEQDPQRVRVCAGITQIWRAFDRGGVP